MKDCGLWKSCFGKRLLGVTRNSLLQPWRGPPAPCGHEETVGDHVRIVDNKPVTNKGQKNGACMRRILAIGGGGVMMEN
jgi:hypothetical protein